MNTQDLTQVKRILVPTDFGMGTQSTLAHACELAERVHADLHVLHVLPAHDLPSPSGTDAQERLRGARERLKQLSQSATNGKLQAVCEVRIGKPSEEIVRYALEQDIGFIAMGTHGRTGLSHAVMGSVAEQVVRHAPCPVLAVRPTLRSPRGSGVWDAAQRLKSGLGTELAGDRNEGWEKMSRLLSQDLDLDPSEAKKLLETLEAMGAIAWRESAGFGGGAIPARKSWTINSEAVGLRDESQGLENGHAQPTTGANAAIDLLRRALADRATDIHLAPSNDDVFQVRLRIDGRLEPYCQLDRSVALPLIQQFKVLASLDIAEPFEPKEGRLELADRMPGVEVRITTAPVQGGTAVALRLFTRDRALMPLERLGLSPSAREAVENILRSGAGLVLVTGPTGSGKTTTIYSLLNLLSTNTRDIISIEDPIEFPLPFIRQLAVDHRHNLTMTTGLRTILRMDPDIIFVSEIRDAEAAEMAMRAASSGRFVFSTLHTRDVASTLTALRDLRIDSRSLAGNLAGLISQRLLRRLCPECSRRSSTLESEAARFVTEGLTASAELGRAVGCAHCRGTGYRDRIGVFEAVSTSADTAEAILSGVGEAEFRKVIRAAGTASLVGDSLQKAIDGLTTIEEALGAKWL
jgi:type II secretory ATPase GspE/PulE/Tfp pilus assembly ATPase PilB-like protein/nucleotide-binding universal stress UspA family protein